MSEQLETLHRQAHSWSTPMQRSKPGWYERHQVRWVAYRAFANTLAAQLPFKWHAVACDNPTQNHTGSSNGQDHIVLDEVFDFGRLHRVPSDALCRPLSAKWGVNLWGESDGPTCKRCLEIAERIIGQA